MARNLPEASLAESIAFNALVIVPNAVQGLFRPRERAVLAATKADVNRWAIALIGGIRRRHGLGPVWVRVLRERALLVLAPHHVRRVLEGSPHPFAPDPEAKRKGMSHFQPDALTLSRGELWKNRRRFTEAVLDTRKPRHRLAAHLAGVARQETEAVLAVTGAELRWDEWHAAFRRIARRVVLGDAARHDEYLSSLLASLMDEANGLPSFSQPSEEHERLMTRVAAYVDAAEAGSLVALFAAAPSDARTEPVGQLPHWLFALSDTLAINAFRALALLTSHPSQRAEAVEEIEAGGKLHYLKACLEETMRLWPTTPVLAREAVEDVEWDGRTVPAGTQLLILNTFHHRDPARHEFADRFAPEVWTHGDAGADWGFNHFSHGAQRCPGAALALLLGAEVLAEVLSTRKPSLLEPQLEPGRPLPHMVDFFRVRFELARRVEPSLRCGA